MYEVSTFTGWLVYGICTSLIIYMIYFLVCQIPKIVKRIPGLLKEFPKLFEQKAPGSWEDGWKKLPTIR